MVVACVAVNCSNKRINSPELSFHRLPKLNDSNKQIRDLSILNVKRDGALPKDITSFYVPNTWINLVSKET